MFRFYNTAHVFKFNQLYHGRNERANCHKTKEKNPSVEHKASDVFVNLDLGHDLILNLLKDKSVTSHIKNGSMPDAKTLSRALLFRAILRVMGALIVCYCRMIKQLRQPAKPQMQSPLQAISSKPGCHGCLN